MNAARFLRSRVTYANVASTLALTLSVSMGGAYAAAQIGAGDIKEDAVRTRHIDDGAVRKNDINDGAIRRAKLMPSARTNVIEYRLGVAHDFAADSEVCVYPGGLTRSQVRNSVWTAQLNDAYDAGGATLDDVVYAVPGAGELGASQYRVFAHAYAQAGTDATRICVVLLSGPGETYDAVRILRTRGFRR